MMVNDVVNQLIIERTRQENGDIDINVRKVPMRAEGVCKTGAYNNVGDDGMDVLNFVDADMLEPIPITPEILLANGFEDKIEYPGWPVEDGGYHVYTKPFGFILTMYVSKGSMMAEDNEMAPWIVCFDVKRRNFLSTVDQLQRWMRGAVMKPTSWRMGEADEEILKFANTFSVVTDMHPVKIAPSNE